jgi:predicted regulator of Ras-like GTPase activity (Roadblock/LC7/MglB family)
MTQPANPDPTEVHWLLSRFGSVAAGVAETVAISIDGRRLAASPGLSRAGADRLTAVTTALASLARGAGDAFDLGASSRVVVELDDGYLMVGAVNAHCRLGIVATSAADLDDLSAALTMVTRQVGAALTPAIVAELAGTVATEQ